MLWAQVKGANNFYRLATILDSGPPCFNNQYQSVLFSTPVLALDELTEKNPYPVAQAASRGDIDTIYRVESAGGNTPQTCKGQLPSFEVGYAAQCRFSTAGVVSDVLMQQQTGFMDPGRWDAVIRCTRRCPENGDIVTDCAKLYHT
ncbi:hypothetical protein EJ07DRAFT_153694 [Lizonia empirigonia]|nr:hypothetical protein EJ07DRAFT_153694 [Lizonia empirigonia]